MVTFVHLADRVYRSYGQGTDGRTQQYLQEAVKSGTLVCLICIEGIKRVDPVSRKGCIQYVLRKHSDIPLTRICTLERISLYGVFLMYKS